MAKITRATQKIFAALSNAIGDFGSAAAGTPVSGTSPTLAAIQSLAQYMDGWGAATLGASKFPAIEDMNAVDQLTTTQLAYILQEGMVEYDAGTTYFQKSIVKKPGTYQIYGSVTDNNIGNALTDVTNWLFLTDLSNSSGFSTGDTKTTYKTTADTGWVMANDGSIGSATSGATTRANADTQALYTLLWTNISNTYAPVSGGRGGSASADFAANKTLTLPAYLGRALAGAGAGSGLTSRALGQTFGEEGHTLTLGENGTHNHTVNITDPGHAHGLLGSTSSASGSSIASIGASVAKEICGDTNQDSASLTYITNAPSGGGAYVSTATTGISAATVNSGSGTAHNTMQPTVFINMMIKL